MIGSDLSVIVSSMVMGFVAQLSGLQHWFFGHMYPLRVGNPVANKAYKAQANLMNDSDQIRNRHRHTDGDTASFCDFFRRFICLPALVPDN
jgi:hypothetical protein